MYLMLSWVLGERPHLDLLPTDDIIALLKILTEVAEMGREIELYIASGGALKLVYPDPATMVTVGEPTFIPKA